MQRYKLELYSHEKDCVKTVLNPTQVHEQNMLRQRVNIIEGTRQTGPVTSEEGVP